MPVREERVVERVEEVEEGTLKAAGDSISYW